MRCNIIAIADCIIFDYWKTSIALAMQTTLNHAPWKVLISETTLWYTPRKVMLHETIHHDDFELNTA